MEKSGGCLFVVYVDYIYGQSVGGAWKIEFSTKETDEKRRAPPPGHSNLNGPGKILTGPVSQEYPVTG